MYFRSVSSFPDPLYVCSEAQRGLVLNSNDAANEGMDS